MVPDGFPEWTEVMDRWGGMMIAAVETVAAMAEVSPVGAEGSSTNSQVLPSLLEAGTIGRAVFYLRHAYLKRGADSRFVSQVGFELESGAFTSRMHLGPHLLAPTGARSRRVRPCVYALRSIVSDSFSRHV